MAPVKMVTTAATTRKSKMRDTRAASGVSPATSSTGFGLKRPGDGPVTGPGSPTPPPVIVSVVMFSSFRV